MGCTVGQALRGLLIQKTDEKIPEMTEYEVRRRNLTALKGLRDEFKGLVEYYHSVVDTYIEVSKKTNRFGDPAISTYQTVRTLNSLTEITVRLQDSVNELLKEFREQEIHVVANTLFDVNKNNYDIACNADLPQSELAVLYGPSSVEACYLNCLSSSFPIAFKARF